MSWIDIIFAPISLPGLQVKKQDLIKNLEKASAFLEHMEYVVDERHRVVEYRNKMTVRVKDRSGGL